MGLSGFKPRLFLALMFNNLNQMFHLLNLSPGQPESPTCNLLKYKIDSR